MKFDFKGFISHLAEELVNSFDYSSNATTPVLIGTAKEKVVIQKLQKLLPLSIGIGSGCIIDNEGNVSKQIDIIIYEKNFCPIFSLGDAKESTYYPCEGVIAAGEIKSKIGQNELVDIFEKSKSVKFLKRHSIPQISLLSKRNVYPYRKYNSVQSIAGVELEDFSQKDKVLDQIFFFALGGDLIVKSETFVNNAIKHLKTIPAGLECNFISILHRGTFQYYDNKSNHLYYSRDNSDSIFFNESNSGNFQQLLSVLNSVIIHGRTVPLNAYDNYLNSGLQNSNIKAVIKKL